MGLTFYLLGPYGASDGYGAWGPALRHAFRWLAAWGSSRVGLPQQRRSPHSSHTCSLALPRAQVSASRPPHLKYLAQQAGIPEAKVVVRLQQLRSAVSFARAASATCPSYSKFGPPEVVPGSESLHPGLGRIGRLARSGAIWQVSLEIKRLPANWRPYSLPTYRATAL